MLAALLSLACAVLCAGAAAQESDPAGDPAGGQGGDLDGDREAEPRLPVEGTLATGYRGRWSDGSDDHDLRATLALDVGDERARGFTGYVLGRFSYDLDGRPESDGAYSFFSLSDTYDHRLVGVLHAAYVDSHHFESLAILRLGRQSLYATPEFAWFDGLQIATRPSSTGARQLGVYAGVPVHLYESSPAGDSIAGAWFSSELWPGSRARADWMHIDDDQRFAEHQDDLLGLDLSQELGAHARLEGEYTRVEETDRDVRGSASWIDPASSFMVRVSHYRLLETQRALVLELDPFFPTLFEHFPFHQTQLLASKGFGQRLDVELGIDVRRVVDARDVGESNRDFERSHLTATFADLLPGGWTLGLTGEAWDGGQSDIRTWGFDLRRDVGERVALSGGSYYSLFKYDLISDVEHDHVRTYFASVRYQPSAALRFELRYELEHDDFDSYHDLRIGTTWSF